MIEKINEWNWMNIKWSEVKWNEIMKKNEWTNESVNEKKVWMNDWKERMNEWMNESINQSMKWKEMK